MFKDIKAMWDGKATAAAIAIVVIVALSFMGGEAVGWIVFGGIVFFFLASMYHNRVERLEMEWDMRRWRRIAKKLDEDERREAETKAAPGRHPMDD